MTDVGLSTLFSLKDGTGMVDKQWLEVGYMCYPYCIGRAIV